MSLKWLLLAAALAAGVAAVAHTEPPVQTSMEAGVEPAVGFGERFRYSVGSVGTALVAGTVRRNVLENEQALSGLGKALKEATGPEAIRAHDIARKIRYADSVAVENLYYGHPIQAIRQTMAAKSLLNAMRTNLREQI